MALDLKIRSTGMIVVFYWSRTGQNWALRRQKWGQWAVQQGGQRLGGNSDGFGLWELPKKVTKREVDEWCETHLKMADRVAVIFPHANIGGASAMSVHTHNLEG